MLAEVAQQISGWLGMVAYRVADWLMYRSLTPAERADEQERDDAMLADFLKKHLPPGVPVTIFEMKGPAAPVEKPEPPLGHPDHPLAKPCALPPFPGTNVAVIIYPSDKRPN